MAAIVAIVLVGVVTGLAALASRKSTGIVKKTTPGEVRQPERPPGILEGKRFRLTYPGGYAANSTGPRDSSALEQYVLLSALPNVRQASITIRKLPAIGLAGDGNFNLRRTYAGQYLQSTVQIGGQQVILMKKNDNAEDVAFIVHDGLLATVALTSTDQNGSLMVDLNNMLQKFEWKL